MLLYCSVFHTYIVDINYTVYVQWCAVFYIETNSVNKPKSVTLNLQLLNIAASQT